MHQDVIDTAPTSTATTRETEPEVVAGISSAEGNPDLPLSFRIAGLEVPVGRALLLLGSGLAIGYGAMRLLRRWPSGVRFIGFTDGG
jgi:hypothetical protein